MVLSFVSKCQRRAIVHTNPMAPLEMKPQGGELSFFFHMQRRDEQ